MRVQVTWVRTDTFIATIEVPDEEAWDLDGDSGVLSDLEEVNAVDVEGNTTYFSTDRDVTEVQLLDASLCHFCKEPVQERAGLWTDQAGRAACTSNPNPPRAHVPLSGVTL